MPSYPKGITAVEVIKEEAGNPVRGGPKKAKPGAGVQNNEDIISCVDGQEFRKVSSDHKTTLSIILFQIPKQGSFLKCKFNKTRYADKVSGVGVFQSYQQRMTLERRPG